MPKDTSGRMGFGPMPADDRNRALIVVVLLFMFMVINFADKAVVGIAAVNRVQTRWVLLAMASSGRWFSFR